MELGARGWNNEENSLLQAGKLCWWLEVEREDMVTAEQLKKSSCLEVAGAGGQLEPLPQPGLGAKGGHAENK